VIHDPPTRIGRIVVETLSPSGTGFGSVLESGEQVFVPINVMRGARLKPGDHVDAKLVPNSFGVDRSACVWFVGYADASTITRPDVMTWSLAVQHLLGVGDAWPVDEIADELGILLGEAAAACEHLYRQGTVWKFVLFHTHRKAGEKVWYTMRPERCDVAEYDDTPPPPTVGET
jgi:hypothetical protein